MSNKSSGNVLLVEGAKGGEFAMSWMDGIISATVKEIGDMKKLLRHSRNKNIVGFV